MALRSAARMGRCHPSAATAARAAPAAVPAFSTKPSLTGGHFGGVHGNKAGATAMQWRNKPLFRREGDSKFKTGKEAAQMLNAEASRRDPNQELFLQTFTSCITHAAPVFDRNPKVRACSASQRASERASQPATRLSPAEYSIATVECPRPTTDSFASHWLLFNPIPETTRHP